MGTKKLRVVMVTTEIVPFSKVGGLADVMGALYIVRQASKSIRAARAARSGSVVAWPNRGTTRAASTASRTTTIIISTKVKPAFVRRGEVMGFSWVLG